MYVYVCILGHKHRRPREPSKGSTLVALNGPSKGSTLVALNGPSKGSTLVALNGPSKGSTLVALNGPIKRLIKDISLLVGPK